jgi:hypothetical protein
MKRAHPDELARATLRPAAAPNSLSHTLPFDHIDHRNERFAQVCRPQYT